MATPAQPFLTGKQMSKLTSQQYQQYQQFEQYGGQSSRRCSAAQPAACQSHSQSELVYGSTSSASRLHRPDDDLAGQSFLQGHRAYARADLAAGPSTGGSCASSSLPFVPLVDEVELEEQEEDELGIAY